MSFARGGGGCFIAGSSVSVPGGYKKIEDFRPGDLALSPSGDKVRAISVYRVEAYEFISIEACGHSVSVTPSHPFKISDGVYREAAGLSQGEMILINRGGESVFCAVEKIKKEKKNSSAYNLLVYPGGEYVSGGFEVHNKGCFLPDTLILKADGDAVSISSLKAGDSILAFEKDGKIVSTKIREVIKLEADEYFELKTDSITVRATAEHPFYAGDGIYKTAASLKKGDFIYIFDGSGLSRSQLLYIEKKKNRTDIYNLRTENPNTFFANFAAVHNKGGGCFPAGVSIASEKGSQKIETLKTGDRVLAFSDGKTVAVRINSAHEKLDRVLTLFTDRGMLRITAEHPILGERGFKPAGKFKQGEKIAFYSGGSLEMTPVRGWALSQTLEKVYNLSVEAPNTFIADGFIVHNKGGGFHSSHYYGSGRSASASKTELVLYCVAILILLVSKFREGDSDGNLDHLFSAGEIRKKSEKTSKLLDFIARTDSNFSKEYLEKTASETFEALQNCWSARDYAPMKPLMMEHLYRRHEAQLEVMRRDHEINILEGLEILSVDIVGLRYTHNPQQRFFTALITARARDYYIDDRSREFLRGDEEPADFQEFWSFKFDGRDWLLDKIEQTAESDALTREDFVEQFTDDSVSHITGAPADAAGPAGPNMRSDVMAKGVKIARMINFLGESDKMWDMSRMEIDASLAFIKVYEAWAAGDASLLPAALISPAMIEELKGLIEKRKADGIQLEFRNLCIRKVDIVLVNNKQDGREDEFVVRFSAHAQKKMIKGQEIIYSDQYVRPFTEYWCFGRGAEKWQLNKILAKGEGELAVDKENGDEESGPMLLQWYYTKKRPY